MAWRHMNWLNPQVALLEVAATPVNRSESSSVPSGGMSLRITSQDREPLLAAEQLLAEAIAIARTIGDQQSIAIALVNLGQVDHLRGDGEAARARYREGLAIFERLGMPEANQVRQLLASLDASGEGRAATPDEAVVALTSAAARDDVRPADLAQACEEAAAAGEMPAAHAAYLRSLAAAVAAPGEETLGALSGAAVALLDAQPAVSPELSANLRLALARFCDRRGAAGLAASAQEAAVVTLRARGEGREEQQALSVALYNQAGYLANAGQLDAAVRALEEVVAIDRRFGLADLASDSAALDAMRRRHAGLPPEEEAGAPEEASEEVSLESLPPEVQEQVRQAAAQLAAMSPEEREAALAAARRQQIEAQADQVVEAAQAAHRDGHVEALIPRLQEAANYFAEGEALDSPKAAWRVSSPR